MRKALIYMHFQTYEQYGKNMEEIIWRGWQNDWREYLFTPFYKKIVWVVGENGNEGKSFFQRNVHEEFGYSKVSALDLGESARNTYNILGKHCSSNTNIFLFNVARGQYLSNEHYKLLKSIKDGKAMEAKMLFTRPNVLIVFANR